MRIRQRLSYSDTKAELREHKDARRGGSEDELWVDTDDLIDYRKTRGKKRIKRGCPGNNGDGHVYATNLTQSWWRDTQGRIRHYTWRDARCCGCNKRAPRGYKE